MRWVERQRVSRNRVPRRVLTAVAVAAALVVSVVATPSGAFADSTVDQAMWANCQSQSSGWLTSDAATLSWLDGTAMRYSVTKASACGTNTQTMIVEGTPQPNDNPQTISLGFGSGSTITGGRNVTPLRSLSWRLLLVNPLGQKELAQTPITIIYPSGTLNTKTFTVTDNSGPQRWDFVRAVATPGATVRIAGNVDLDLSGLPVIEVAPNVQILGDRSVNPVGPLLFTTTEPDNLFDILPASSVSHERISGIRLRGGSSTDPFSNEGDGDSNGIRIRKPNVQIDHNEIYLWRGAGVSVIDTPDNLITRSVASSVSIHDNYIHHDQHPTGDLLGGHSGGYGVSVVHGAYARVERNVFDYNRHSMMAGGDTGTGYLFYRNLILPHGGDNSRVVHTHAIDVHGTNKNDSYESGQAGEYFDVELNTVWNGAGPGLKLRGTPTDSMYVKHNVFVHCGLFGASVSGSCTGTPALIQNQSGMNQSDNTVGAVVGGDARTSCDFDGDGVSDVFHATGVTLWFQSSRLSGRYVYLAQSTATGAGIQLGDRNNDGLCDVTAGATTFYSDPANVVGPSSATASRPREAPSPQPA